ncbi:TNF receptor-associated factor 3-like, partial [Paramuricea clavata]
MPGFKITDEDRRRIDAKFICTLCKLLLYIPYQTVCGHLMCQSCVENLLKSPNPRCPEDGEELSEEKGHSQVCEYALIKCDHSQCEMKIQRSHLPEHSRECEYRKVMCDRCGQDVVFALMK